MTVARNLALYPAYQAAWMALFWLPVFFLYFSSVLAPGDVFSLEAIYYLAVVLLEVPSGYLSDRVGRRPTLILGMLSWACASAVFAASGSFWAFAVAQVLLAGGMAFNSGSDSALLYDSLSDLGREHEFAGREARARSVGLGAMSGAALVGGAVAVVDLRLAYVLSAVSAVVAMGVAIAMVEPRRSASAGLPGAQLRAVAAALRRPLLVWVLAASVAGVVFNHVPYELFQPYVALLFGDPAAGPTATPMVAGVLTAVTALLAAGASGVAPGLAKRIGARPTLVAALAGQGIVIAAMAAFLSPLVLVLVMARGVPGAVMRPIADSLVHPHLRGEIRATYLSVQSLAGRLAFAGALAITGVSLGGADLTPGTVAAVAAVYAVGVAVVVVGLAMAAVVTGDGGVAD